VLAPSATTYLFRSKQRAQASTNSITRRSAERIWLRWWTDREQRSYQEKSGHSPRHTHPGAAASWKIR